MDSASGGSSATDRRVRRQEAVSELGQRALESDDIDQFLHEASVAVAEALNTEYCEVVELSAGKDEGFLRQGVGWRDGVVGSATVTADPESRTGYTLRAEGPVIVDDFGTDERFSGSELLAGHDVVSGISVSIGPPEDPWGVLGTYTTERREFTAHDARFVGNVADILSTAISHGGQVPDDPPSSSLRDDVPGMVYRCPVDRERPMAFVSHTCESVVGYDSGAFERGEVAWDDLIVAEDREEVRREIREKVGDGAPFSVAYRVETASGERRWVRDHGRRVSGGADPVIEGVVSDITDRGRPQHDYQRVMRALEAAEEGISLLDDDGEFIYVNDAYAAVFGYDPEEMLGEHWEDLGIEADPDYVYDEILPAVEREGQWTGTTTCLRSDGTTFLAQHSLTQTENDELICVIRDVTEHEQRARELEESRRQYRTLVENFPNGAVALVDEDLCYRTVGGNAPAVAGVTSEEMEGRPVAEALPSALVAELVPHYRAALDGESGAFETEFEGRTYQFQVVPVRDDDGEVFAALGMSQDVTERKERERELRRQRERLTALNHLNEVVRDINRTLVQQSTREDIERTVCEQLAGSDSYKFAWVGRIDNETLEVAPSASANTGEYLDEVTVTADDSPTGQGPSGRAFRTREFQIVKDIQQEPQFDPWREQLTRRGIEAMTSIPISYEERFYGVLNVFTTRTNAFDEEEAAVVSQLGEIMGLAITAIEHERQLQHRHEQLAFINSLLRHNLLNDLNVVHARAGILEPHVDADGHQHLEIIQTHADEMAALIETLRSLTEALVEDEHELDTVDVGGVLRQEVEKTASAFEDATFDIATALDDVPPVMADDLLGEVFQNLLVNAVQHNDKDTPRITVDVTADEEHVTVRVADNGPGIPAELKAKLFEKGQKHRHSQGTGYGLHLVQEILELYDGEILAENEETGAVFSVVLPRA